MFEYTYTDIASRRTRLQRMPTYPILTRARLSEVSIFTTLLCACAPTGYIRYLHVLDLSYIFRVGVKCLTDYLANLSCEQTSCLPH